MRMIALRTYACVPSALRLETVLFAEVVAQVEGNCGGNVLPEDQPAMGSKFDVLDTGHYRLEGLHEVRTPPITDKAEALACIVSSEDVTDQLIVVVVRLGLGQIGLFKNGIKVTVFVKSRFRLGSEVCLC